jgi:hypothetical protein
MTDKIYNVPQYWAFTDDEDRAVELLREVGFWHLSGYAGCLCGHIRIFAFDIDISCRKSDNSITVSSRYTYMTEERLQKIADEVLRQYLDQGEAPPRVRVTIE